MINSAPLNSKKKREHPAWVYHAGKLIEKVFYCLIRLVYLNVIWIQLTWHLLEPYHYTLLVLLKKYAKLTASGGVNTTLTFGSLCTYRYYKGLHTAAVIKGVQELYSPQIIMQYVFGYISKLLVVEKSASIESIFLLMTF